VWQPPSPPELSPRTRARIIAPGKRCFPRFLLVLHGQLGAKAAILNLIYLESEEQLQGAINRDRECGQV